MIQPTGKFAGVRPEGWKHGHLSLEGKVAIITGGTTGIGRSTALLLAAQGVRVALFGRRQDHLDEAVETLRDHGYDGLAFTTDVTDHTQLRAFFQEVDDELGGLDILVNNAGLAASTVSPGQEGDEGEDYQRFHYVLETNILGYMDCARQAARRMIDRGTGHIVNIGSMSAESKGAGSDVYVATKSAIRGFSEALAKQMGEHDVRVSLIEPGLTGADLFDGEKADPKVQRRMQEEKKMMTSEDIAEAILYCLIQPTRANVVSMQVHQLKSGK